jgi:transcriptional regulator with XRE-family HTH domain
MEKSLHSAAHRRLVDALKAARARAGLTQEQAAVRLSAYPTFFSKLETGERRLDVVEFVAVCEALAADPVEVMREAGLVG